MSEPTAAADLIGDTWAASDAPVDLQEADASTAADPPDTWAAEAHAALLADLVTDADTDATSIDPSP